MTGPGAKDAPRPFADEELAWAGEHLPELRRSAFGQRLLYQSLGVGFVVGLAAHVAGYLLRSSATTEPLGLVADLLYGLGYALWTGVVVVVFVQVVPEVSGARSSGGWMPTRRRRARRPEATGRRGTTKRRRRGGGPAGRPAGGATRPGRWPHGCRFAAGEPRAATSGPRQAGAAAALTGLLFVSLSINLHMRGEAWLPRRAAPTLVLVLLIEILW
jgi:hypothetical protein